MYDQLTADLNAQLTAVEVQLGHARKALGDHEEERRRLSAIEDRLTAIEEQLDELLDLARSQGLRPSVEDLCDGPLDLDERLLC